MVPRFLLLCALLAWPRAAAAEELRFAIGPPPSWVDEVPVPDRRSPPADAAASYTLLDDTQLRYAGPQTQRFYHYAELVVTPTGIDNAATVNAYFEPSYETLTLHWVRIHRGLASRDVLVRGQVRLAHVEDDLDARLYHGQAQAIFFVPDVRVGDVVEVAFTTTGDNPVFAGRVSGAFNVARTYPIGRLRTRLLVPAGRPLRMRGRGAGSHTEYVHDGSNLAAVEVDSETPAWHPAVPTVWYSDFTGWADVAAWAEPLYKVTPQARAALRPIIDQVAAAGPDPLVRLRAAARFVQDEVRYLGIEVGPSSHQPHPPDEVLAQRFGDCKDKALLLVSLLRALDIDAEPALVHSYRGPGLPDVLPDPFAFNHVVVRARVGADEHWIDATDVLVRGQSFPPMRYRWALPVRGGGDALAPIPQPELLRPTVDVLEEWSVPESAVEPALLDVTTRRRGADADEMRAQLAGQTLADLGRDYLNYYAQDFPEIEAAGEPVVEDDTEYNEIIVRERYRVPGFWDEGKRWFGARDVTGMLRKPSQPIRTMPLWVGHAAWVRQTIDLQLPADFQREDADQSVRNDHFEYTLKARRTEGGVILIHDLKTSGEPVPPGDVADYARAVDEVGEAAGYELTQGQGWGWEEAEPEGWLFAGGFLVVALSGIGLFIWLANRKRD